MGVGNITIKSFERCHASFDENSCPYYWQFFCRDFQDPRAPREALDQEEIQERMAGTEREDLTGNL